MQAISIDLPDDTIKEIFMWLTAADRVIMCLVCKSWCDIAIDVSKELLHLQDLYSYKVTKWPVACRLYHFTQLKEQLKGKPDEQLLKLIELINMRVFDDYHLCSRLKIPVCDLFAQSRDIDIVNIVLYSARFDCYPHIVKSIYTTGNPVIIKHVETYIKKRIGNGSTTPVIKYNEIYTKAVLKGICSGGHVQQLQSMLQYVPTKHNIRNTMVKTAYKYDQDKIIKYLDENDYPTRYFLESQCIKLDSIKSFTYMIQKHTNINRVIKLVSALDHNSTKIINYLINIGVAIDDGIIMDLCTYGDAKLFIRCESYATISSELRKKLVKQSAILGNTDIVKHLQDGYEDLSYSYSYGDEYDDNDDNDESDTPITFYEDIV